MQNNRKIYEDRRKTKNQHIYFDTINLEKNKASCD